MVPTDSTGIEPRQPAAPAGRVGSTPDGLRERLTNLSARIVPHTKREQGRQEPERPARVEPAKTDTAGPVVLLEEQARDEEAAQREEDIHSEPATREQARVIEHTRERGQTPKAVERRPVAQVEGRHGGDRHRSDTVIVTASRVWVEGHEHAKRKIGARLSGRKVRMLSQQAHGRCRNMAPETEGI